MAGPGRSAGQGTFATLCNRTFKKIWLDLKPSGTIDLETNIGYVAESKKLSIGVHAKPQIDATSVEPVFFPYRMEKVQGDLFYRDGHVTLQKMRATHGKTNLATEAICDFQPLGPWQIHFQGLAIDQLDREFIQALPERLKKAILALNPTGSMNLSGELDFSHCGVPGGPLQSRWGFGCESVPKFDSVRRRRETRQSCGPNFAQGRL